MVRFTEIEFNSDKYRDSIELRYEVLRKPLSLEFDPEVLALEYKDHHICAFSEDKKLIGCLIMSPVNNGLVKMRQFAVATDYQKQGIGKSLVLFAEKWAAEKQYNRIEMHARLTAVPFYLKLGYTIEGEEFIEVTILHRFMYKILGESQE